jgi:UDP:flavonoid glycosyltransferase YjiC (YdhE family)
VILATIGSLGDLHPFIALGLALRARNASVVVACASEYQAKVERAGLAFLPVRPSFADMERDLGMNLAQLTSAAMARSDFLLRKLIMPHLRSSYEDMLAIMEDADMVLTHSLAFGARLAAERSGIPWIAVVLQPFMFMSAFDPPVTPKVAWLSPLLRRLGPALTRCVLEFVKHAFDAQLRPVHALRREIGLAPTRLNPLFEGQFSPAGAIGLYAKAMGDIRADYPQSTAITGFAFFDSDDGAPASLDSSLSEFLAAGTKPLVFTLGSLIVNSPGSFYRESSAAARILGKRAVLLVGELGAGDYAGLRSADVHVCGYASHSLLFPRAEAIVHHGGVGTLAQALRSGRPQLIVPFYADQLDNAARTVKLGVARSLAPRRYDAASASRELATLMTMPDFQLHAAQVRGLLAGEDGAARAASIILDRIELQHQDGEDR